MNNQEAEAWRQKAIEATKYRDKLRLARERKGWPMYEAAAQINRLGSQFDYYDIEEHDRDLTYGYSLNEISHVCKILDIRPSNLFCDEASVAISIFEVVEKIKKHCADKKISIGEFEDVAGWKLENSLTKPEGALDDWNIDCLIDVCRELEIDWRNVAAGL